MSDCSTGSGPSVPKRCSTWWNDAALALLAGGRGRRLGGQRKALLVHQGQTLLERTLAGLGTLFAERLVICASPDEDPEGVALHAPLAEAGRARIVTDRRPGRGAPGGLEAALAEAKAPWIFVVGCDQPFVDREVVDWQARARQASIDAVLLHGPDQRPEPLHAFYHRRTLRPLTRLLDEGHASLHALLTLLRTTHPTSEDGAPTPAEIARSLTNINTPDDLVRL